MDTGSIVRESRLAAHLTQAQLAALAGTSQAAIARYETGAVSPAVDTLQRILASCGRSLVMTTEARTAVSATSPRIAILRAHRRQILRLARAHGARDVRVFGSVVRGEDVAGSDIDLLVSFDVRGPEGLLPMARLRQQIEQLLGERVDVVPEALLRPSVAAEARREALAL